MSSYSYYSNGSLHRVFYIVSFWWKRIENFLEICLTSIFYLIHSLFLLFAVCKWAISGIKGILFFLRIFLWLFLSSFMLFVSLSFFMHMYVTWTRENGTSYELVMNKWCSVNGNVILRIEKEEEIQGREIYDNGGNAVLKLHYITLLISIRLASIFCSLSFLIHWVYYIVTNVSENSGDCFLIIRETIYLLIPHSLIFFIICS